MQMARVLCYNSGLTLSQSFQQMAAQLSVKAALPLAVIFATVLQRSKCIMSWSHRVFTSEQRVTIQHYVLDAVDLAQVHDHGDVPSTRYVETVSRQVMDSIHHPLHDIRWGWFTPDDICGLAQGHVDWKQGARFY